MSSVWVVTSGEYSAYQICAVFSTAARAEEFKAAGGGDSVEEHGLDTWQDDQGTWAFGFDIATGQILSEEHESHLDPASDNAGASTWQDSPIHISVDTGDHARALKIATERFYRIKAEWDNAERAVRSLVPDNTGDQQLILAVAEVMAGIEQPPLTPSSTFGEWTRKALGL